MSFSESKRLCVVQPNVPESVSAHLDYPATLAALETELVNLITESLWQLERIAELQNKIRSVTQSIEQGLSEMTFPPVQSPGSAN